MVCAEPHNYRVQNSLFIINTKDNKKYPYMICPDYTTNAPWPTDPEWIEVVYCPPPKHDMKESVVIGKDRRKGKKGKFKKDWE